MRYLKKIMILQDCLSQCIHPAITLVTPVVTASSYRQPLTRDTTYNLLPSIKKIKRLYQCLQTNVFVKVLLKVTRLLKLIFICSLQKRGLNFPLSTHLVDADLKTFYYFDLLFRKLSSIFFAEMEA